MSSSRLSFTLNHVVGALNRSADQILRERFGVTFSQFLFLITVNRDDPVSQGTLARRLGVSKPAVSKRISWFVDRGLVHTGGRGSDQRIVTIGLTAKGRQRAALMSDVLETQFRALFDDLPDVDPDQLNRTLRAIVDRLDPLRTSHENPGVLADV